MRLFILIIFSIQINYACGQKPVSYDLAFINKKGIVVYSLKDKKEIKIWDEDYLNGTAYPYISPNGTELAFTDEIKNGNRRICIINLATNNLKVLNINSTQCFGSIWSPDGKYIAVHVLQNRKWKVVIVDVLNNKQINITRNIMGDTFSPSWTHDSKGILIHDMNTIFQIDLNGNIIKKYKIKGFGTSSSDKCIMTADNQNIIYETLVSEPSPKEFQGVVNVIFIYNIKNNKSNRLTPAGFSCDTIFLEGIKVFFNSFNPKSKSFDIYSVYLNGKNFKLEFKGCRNLTKRIKK